MSHLSSQPGDPTAPPPPHLRILVIDDHADSANAIVKLLTIEGYHTQAAYGFTDALDRCRENSFDLLLVDLQLPDGDGVQLLDALRNHCHPAAIALTGSSDNDDIARARRAGFADYLVKPFPIPSLLAAIARTHRRPS